jgi:exopolyphosphatase/guanosine-5'-triphosphate,3'-diphosphate pyrophosphatase
MENGALLAAVDLGSNSYRLEIGRLEHGHVHRTEYIKETIRQGNGLDENRNLRPEAMQRGWDCLARFAERLSGFDKKNVRAVATQTLREAKNREEFLDQASRTLGFPIEVISGREEARLIYEGVAQLLPQSKENRLVIDIGGRSTEIILGKNLNAEVMESYRTGSVAWSMKYFKDDLFSLEAFEKAEIAAKAVLDEAFTLYPKESWDQAYGSSGTIGAVCDILFANGWNPDEITRSGLAWLKKSLIRAGTASNLRLEGLKEDRKAVIGGGISVLIAVFDILEIDTMHCAQGALRHGVLYDLIDRDDDQYDVRSITITRLQKVFGVDMKQSQRVSQVANFLFDQLNNKELDQTEQSQLKKKLTWACDLHEIGMVISHSDYHKHGAYILDQSDTPGFTIPELHRLSLLVLGHRGKLRKLNINFDDESFCHQLLCLRLAVISCHAKREPDYKSLKIKVSKKSPKTIDLEIPKAWTQSYPQSFHLLQMETQSWLKTSWDLRINSD